MSAGTERPVDDAAPLPRGTVPQRVRAAAVRIVLALLAALPDPVADGLADALGELWYRAAPARAARARGNLAHVVEHLATRGLGSPRARSAAADPAALERLVRAAFRHAVRTYLETLRGGAVGRRAASRLDLENAAEVNAALDAPGPAVFASLHFGSLAAMSAVLALRSRVPVTAPMEVLADPELQRVMARARASVGLRIVGLTEARRELRAALVRGERVGIIADRDIAGGGIEVPLFGLPAALPIGPAYLALETGAPLHVATARRAAGGRFVGRLVGIALPPVDLPRRARVETVLAAEAGAFEELVAAAPEQWWAVFYPIWAAVGPRERGRPVRAPARSPG